MPSPHGITYKLYVIFHKELFRECYKEIPEDVFRRTFTCVAVNEAIEKRYDPWFEPSIIKEYELPHAHPRLQEMRMCESSVLLHLFFNRTTLVDPYDFIGCFHYDMIIKPKAFEQIEEICSVAQSPFNTVFYVTKAYGFSHFGSSFNKIMKEECLSHDGWFDILSKYNAFFGTQHQYDMVVFDDIPINHCFIVHTDLFKKITPFVISVLPNIVEKLGNRPRHLPYTLETLWGMVLMLNKRETGARWVALDVIHDEGMKDSDFLEVRKQG
jgi:hypothetical protein